MWRWEGLRRRIVRKELRKLMMLALLLKKIAKTLHQSNLRYLLLTKKNLVRKTFLKIGIKNMMMMKNKLKYKKNRF